MLDEVTVTSSVVQIINKGDTIQFNAEAFELAEGSMLSSLVKKLPGVELRDNGQIYVNGRFVDKLLLNGKDFFNGDKMVLLQNLPAYTVKNVQVYQQDKKDQEQKQQQGGLSEASAQQILKAMEDKENGTRQKVELMKQNEEKRANRRTTDKPW